MANLLDLMSPEDKQRAIEAFEQRMHGNSGYRKTKVSPVAFLLAEVGMFFGWGAIEAAKRGYVTAYRDDGSIAKIPLTMEELSALADAGRKISYSNLLNQARGTQIATGSVLSKHPKQDFEKGMSPVVKKIRE